MGSYRTYNEQDRVIVERVEVLLKSSGLVVGLCQAGTATPALDQKDACPVPIGVHLSVFPTCCFEFAVRSSEIAQNSVDTASPALWWECNVAPASCRCAVCTRRVSYLPRKKHPGFVVHFVDSTGLFQAHEYTSVLILL